METEMVVFYHRPVVDIFTCADAQDQMVTRAHYPDWQHADPYWVGRLLATN